MALALTLAMTVQMFVAFPDGTSYTEEVARKVCEDLNEASGDPDKVLYLYDPNSGDVKRIVMVICRGENDDE
jgi:hypothetical protein